MIEKPEKKTRTPSTRNLVAMFNKLPTLELKQAAFRVLEQSLRSAEEADLKAKEAERARKSDITAMLQELESRGLAISDLVDHVKGLNSAQPLQRKTSRKSTSKSTFPQDGNQGSDTQPPAGTPE